jgi:hypothetical protein
MRTAVRVMAVLAGVVLAIALLGCSTLNADRFSLRPRVVYRSVAASTAATSVALAGQAMFARPLVQGRAIRLPGADASCTLVLASLWRDGRPGDIADAIFEAIGSGDTAGYSRMTGHPTTSAEMTAARVALFGTDVASTGGTTFSPEENPDLTQRRVFAPLWSANPSALFMRFALLPNGHYAITVGVDSSLSSSEIARLVNVANISNEPSHWHFGGVGKPVIYLYPTRSEHVSVHLDLRGRLTSSSPEVDAGDPAWQVLADPSGTLTTSDGRRWPYLFWEADLEFPRDLSQGFCVPGRETRAFLEDALARQGLAPTERTAFEAYWVPRMSGNAYNVVSFQGEPYRDAARLVVTPRPDTVIRVLMAFAPSAVPVSLLPQRLFAPKRSGFTVVEWGGCESR